MIWFHLTRNVYRKNRKHVDKMYETYSRLMHIYIYTNERDEMIDTVISNNHGLTFTIIQSNVIETATKTRYQDIRITIREMPKNNFYFEVYRVCAKGKSVTNIEGDRKIKLQYERFYSSQPSNNATS